MSATTLPQDVAEYLDRVRGELADLPAEERDELLSDVEGSLLDAAGDSSAPLADRLGPPERFARELRAAAGLAPQPAVVADEREALRDRLSRHARELRARLPELMPVWWALRGYLAVAGFALLVGSDWSIRLAALPKVLPDAGASIVVILAAVAASLWIGRRFGRRMLPVDALLAAAAFAVVAHVATAPNYGNRYRLLGPPPAAIEHHGYSVRNLYAYDRKGRLLRDIRIFDDRGTAMNLGAKQPSADPLRRRVRTQGGALVLNAFPIRYVEPDTGRVRRPNAGPGIVVPPLRTAPLRAP